MRILLATTDAFGGHGGIAQYNRDLACAFSENALVHDVQLVVRVQPLPLEELPLKVNYRLKSTRSRMYYIKETLGAMINGVDLIVCGHINLLPALYILSRIFGVPIILVVYGIDVWDRPSLFKRMFVRKVNRVWSISVATLERMNMWAKLSMESYVTLPNAIRLSRYGLKERNRELLDLYGLSGYRTILTLARLPSRQRGKGVDEVLEIMPTLKAHVPNLKYLVVGDGDDKSRLVEKAALLGLENDVVFTGRVSESIKADIYRLADVFVMPSSGEGFGFVFLEALACGIPVVGSSLDGGKDALRGGELGELCDPRLPQSIVTAVLKAFDKSVSIPDGLLYFAWENYCNRVDAALRLDATLKNKFICED